MGSFPGLFDGHYDNDIYFHTPNHFIPNLSDPHVLGRLRNLQISLAIGEHDPFGGSNRRLSESWWEKGVAHTLDIWGGEAHRARDWREMAPRYFRRRFLKPRLPWRLGGEQQRLHPFGGCNVLYPSERAEAAVSAPAGGEHLSAKPSQQAGEQQHRDRRRPKTMNNRVDQRSNDRRHYETPARAHKMNAGGRL